MHLLQNMKKIVSNIKTNLYDKEEFSDCVFIIENKKIFAHKGNLYY